MTEVIRLIYRAEPEYHTDLEEGAADCFPLVFAKEKDYATVDRLAGVWLSLGLTVLVEKTTTGYRLTLDHPEAVPTSKT